jgi:hypothetical protein
MKLPIVLLNTTNAFFSRMPVSIVVIEAEKNLRISAFWNVACRTIKTYSGLMRHSGVAKEYFKKCVYRPHRENGYSAVCKSRVLLSEVPDLNGF